MIDFTKINAFPAASFLRQVEIENIRIKSENALLKNVIGVLLIGGVAISLVAIYKKQKNGAGKNK